MLTPKDIQTKAHKKVQRYLKELLCEIPVPFAVPLHPPTGQKIHTNPDAASAFVRAWENNPLVTWETRDFSRWGLGKQNLPTRFTTTTNQELISTAGMETEFTRLRTTLNILMPNPNCAAARTATVMILPLWRGLASLDAEQAKRVTSWFHIHPNSGLLPRAIPIDGVHGKWLENHRRLIEHLVAISHGDYSGEPANLGLKAAPPSIRLRYAPDSAPGNLDDIQIPVTALPTALHGIKRVVFLENLETFLALNPGPQTCLVFGGGYRAHTAVAHPAFSDKEIYYWGDLDLDGYAILDAVRAHRPDTKSVVMGRKDVEKHLHLGTSDRPFTPTTLTRLTPDELAALELLINSGHQRIEQERINFNYAVLALAEYDLVKV